MEAIESVCVIGAGYMGSQIGLQCAIHGYPVNIYDISEDALKSSREAISSYVESLIHDGDMIQEEKLTVMEKIHHVNDIEEAASDVDLVIEAVTERLDVKREVFSKLDEVCRGDTILATNSSSIRVSKIEGATQRLDKVINMHFYSRRTRIVELMRGTATTDETVEAVRKFSRSIGVTPLIVLKESTGFIFNRVWRAIKRECLHLVDDGVASFEDVDRAWMSLYGTGVGPFGLMDRVGLDVVRDIEMVYYEESGDPWDAPPRLLLDKVKRGELGVKTGRGFYAYPNPRYENPDWLHGEA